MSQRQQYAVVLRSPNTAMKAAGARCGGIGYDFAHYAWDEMVKAAPPPPDQVLSDEEIQALWGLACHDDSIAGPSRQIRFARAIERAILKQLGAKNV